jgi:superfamily II DNA or RNA helicase
MSDLGLQDVKEKISQPQLEAIEVIEEYLNSDGNKYQALVKMPTGTGKTGIIGIVSNFYDKHKNILIVVPNSILPSQIEDEIWVNFWKNIGLDRSKLKIKFPCVYKVKNFQIPNKDEGTIIITTIQSLVTIYQEEYEKYFELQRNIDLVIFDEGHREPSLIWSKAIRQLQKKVILFTATPYRNDEAFFSFHEKKFKYNLTFSRAVELGLIKNVKFNIIPTSSIQSINSFCEFVLDLYSQSSSQKILIRCKDREEIKEITTKINSLYVNRYHRIDADIALGCHSTFSDENSNYLEDNGEKIFKRIDSYQILIHENMLIEGINIPEIDILIMYGDFKNTRSLIQQIGRIVRKNKVRRNAIVYIREQDKEKYISQWDKFLKYENELTNNSSELTVSYYDKEFKDIFVLNNDFYKELLIPKSSIIYEFENIEFIKLIGHLKDNLINRSNIRHFYEYNNEDIWVMCYEKISYANILKSKLYKEVTLECMILRTIIKNDRKFLFYYDSRGYALPFDVLDEYIKRVDIKKMLSLFPETTTNFNQIKLNSIGLSNYGIYGRVVEGNNIQSVHTNINERLSFCKFVQGTIGDKGKRLSRYIGTTNSRIIDYERGSLEDYCKWSDEIVENLFSGVTNGYFSRFALPVNKKDGVNATSILLDFTGVSDIHKVYKRTNSEELTGIESICTTCINFSFTFVFNNDTISGKVERTGSGKETRFRLNIPKFKSDYYIDYNYEKVSLEHFINKEQSFRVFFNQEGLIYSDGYFFKPNIRFESINLDETDLGKRIFALDGLDKCCEEKFGGAPSKSVILNKWPTDSVFGCFIDKIMNNKGPFLHTNIDYLICDDLQKEIADFIAIDEQNQKVIVVHCKHKESIKSASAFQDLCGQAVKNIGYLIKNNVDLMDLTNHIKLWDNEWNNYKKYGKGKSLKTVRIKTKRIIKGNITGEAFWEKYKSIIKSPDSKTEVWLVMDGLSRNVLKQQLEKDKPEEQISQLMWILYCTQEIISEVGGVLKVFCRE